jgi:hypothetical protein
VKKIVAGCVLAASLLVVGCTHPAPAYYAFPAPPPALPPVAQQGFHDGFEAAQRDIQQGRRPRFARHPRYRNPPVPSLAFAEYRKGFRLGYEQALRRPPPPPPQ